MRAAPATASVPEQPSLLLPWKQAVLVFLSFAFAYFLSALVRAVTATLAPQFSTELQLSSGDLGLLAGAYFLGFASMQLPLGSALDRHGSRRVLLALLSAAVLGCVAFATATSFLGLTLARSLIGMGVAACLMAPLTTYRHRFTANAQMRANSWMLMTGSLGMVTSTLPVQWLLPLLGWRGLFWVIAALVALAMLTIYRLVPQDRRVPVGHSTRRTGYGEVLRHATFQRFAPLGFFLYGGMIAVQALWAGPWFVEVAGRSPAQAAQGLFAVNVAMLLTFMGWGLVVPRLYARGWTAQRLVALGVPSSLLMIGIAVGLGKGAATGVWTLFCVTSTFVSLSQPAIGQAFPASLAGRALSAYNLVIFAGVFVLQWGIGLVIDLLRSLGWATVSAFQGAFALFGLCCLLSYLWFLLWDDADNHKGS